MEKSGIITVAVQVAEVSAGPTALTDIYPKWFTRSVSIPMAKGLICSRFAKLYGPAGRFSQSQDVLQIGIVTPRLIER